MLKTSASQKDQPPARRRILSAALLLAAALPLRAATTNDVAEEIRLLREENGLLKTQVKQQGEQLDILNHKVSNLETASGTEPPTKESFPSFNRVNLGGEGGVGYAITGPDGAVPNGQFRVDDARLFVEAPLWTDIYFYGELLLATQESPGMSAQLGELYVEFENISKLWHQDNQLNARLGQINTPFGEEYLVRNPIDNPLITHSLADFWCVTPGAELYGNLGKFTYVVAAQNGGENAGGDKAVAGRIGFDPNEHWHFSVSGMRTGNLQAGPFSLSQMWFGNGFFRSIGSPMTTQFHAEAVEGDLTARWKSGQVSTAGGWAGYHDNDPLGGNSRNAFYYSAEAVQNLPKKFFAATRWSQVFCHGGIPVVGYGNFDDYFFGPLTTELWRLSLGLGYRFNDRLVLKTEYSFERGRTTGGNRQNEDFFGTEAAFKF